jgi:heme exporter protein C
MAWKYLTVLLFVIVIIFSLMPQMAGTIDDAYYYSQFDTTKYIPVKAKILKPAEGDIIDKSKYNFIDAFGNKGKVCFTNSINPDALYDRILIYKIRFDKNEKCFITKEFSEIKFFITFPFTPGLEERSRIILFHVPVAWISVLAFLVSMTFGIRYLMKKNMLDDEKSVIAAGLGFLFCILATITGSIWAKFNWGSFWNWDPRETSIFILLLIYGAYFALRSAIEIEEKKATLSSIYSILAFITVPFFIFIMPRITAGLHPGSADDMASPGGGPVVRSGMSFEMRIIFFLSLIAFTMLFFWLFDLRVRASKLSNEK